MKDIILLGVILLVSFNLQAQTEIADTAQAPTITAIPYDGSFMKFESSLSEGRKAGVVGEEVTLVDVGYYFIFDK